VIQDNEIWRIEDPIHRDGHGVVFMGVTGSRITHNYTHDTMSAYVLTHDLSHDGGRPSANNTLCYNISERDVLGLNCWGDVRDTLFHNNTIFAEWPPTGPFGAAVAFSDFTGRDVYRMAR